MEDARWISHTDETGGRASRDKEIEIMVLEKNPNNRYGSVVRI